MKKNKGKKILIFVIIYIFIILVLGGAVFFTLQSMFPGDINCPGYDSDSQTMVMGVLSSSGAGFEILPGSEYCIPISSSACPSKFIGRAENPASMVSPWQFPIANTLEQTQCDRIGNAVVNTYHQITLCDISPTVIDYTNKKWMFEYRPWEQGILPQPSQAYFKDKGNSMCFKFDKYQTGFTGTVTYYLNSTPKIISTNPELDPATPTTELTGEIEVCSDWSECGYVENKLTQSRYCYEGTKITAAARDCTETIKETIVEVISKDPENPVEIKVEKEILNPITQEELEIPVLEVKELKELIFNNSAPVIGKPVVGEKETITKETVYVNPVKDFIVNYKYYIISFLILILIIGIIVIGRKK